MTAPPPPPPTLSPDARAATRAAARWRAVALSLAVVSAFLSGLLLLSLGADSASKDADAGAKDAATDDADADTDTDTDNANKRGRIAGVAVLSGTPPTMLVPRRRKTADYCKSKPLPSNAVKVKDGRLQDVLVRIENGGVKGDYAPPDTGVAVNHADCQLAPRIQGAMLGQALGLQNADPVLHNVHAYVNNKSVFNRAQPSDSMPLSQLLDMSGIFKIVCDVHPWERSFLVVTDHPYFAVTDEDGEFAIPDVPVGRYMLEAWHPRFGLRRFPVDVDDKTAKVTFTYESTDPEPDINKGELDGQF